MSSLGRPTDRDAHVAAQDRPELTPERLKVLTEDIPKALAEETHDPWTGQPKSAASACPKCASEDVAVSYHPHMTYCNPHSRYTYSHKDGEHLHFTCRRCSYDWTGDVADAAA